METKDKKIPVCWEGYGQEDDSWEAEEDVHEGSVSEIEYWEGRE
jgi:hypothetical protein